MSDLFHFLAAEDDSHHIAQRKAVAVANKRVKDRYSAFLANARGDLKSRIALIEDDIHEVVASVVEEYGGDADKIETAIMRSLSGNADHLKEYQFKPKGEKPDAGEEEAEVENEEAEEEAEAENPKTAAKAASRKKGYGYDENEFPDSGYPEDEEEWARREFMDPGGNSALRAGERVHPCPNCGTPNSLTDKDVQLGYQCDRCADAAEGHGGYMSNVREARRPKMCPYHSEVTDIALGTGDPQAGYNAMSSQAWGDNHCKGGFDGSCNFKPAMVTQKFWDDKKTEYEERALQREQQGQETQPTIETQPIMNAEPLPDLEGEGITDIDHELAEAPSAVGEMALAHIAAGPVFQPGDRVFSHYVMDWGTVERVGQTTPETTHGVTGSPLPASTWYTVRMDKSGSIEMLDDAGGDWDLARIVPPEIAERYGYGSDPQGGQPQGGQPNDPRSAANAPAGAGGAVVRESLPSADESGLGGPSPKIDKGNSGDEWHWTLDDIDTETANTPNPSVDQDIKAKPEFDKDNFLDQTDSVTKQEDLPANSGDAGYGDSPKPAPTSDPYTWTEDNGTNPVTKPLGDSVLAAKLAMPSAMTAQDFVMLADAIATAPGDQVALANHFADYLARTNPAFDRERFIAAATGNPSTGRDRFTPPEGTDPQLGLGLQSPGTMSSANPLREIIDSNFGGFLPASDVDAAVSDFER